MNTLGVIALVNFSDWDDPDYRETGGINSVIKNILPYLTADKIVLYGFTTSRENLYKEKVIHSRLSVFPTLFVPPNTTWPIRLHCILYGWKLRYYIRLHGITNIYCHAEELGIWLPLKKLRLIHHIHTYVNVLQVSSRKSAGNGILQYFWERIRIHVIRNAYKVIAVNSDVVNLITTHTSPEKVIKFPNYVDTTKFKFTPPIDLLDALAIKDNRIVLHVGRISLVKGLDLFVDTIQTLNNKDQENWIGIIVGNGEHETTLKNYVESKGLKKNILFTGPINNTQELAKFYSLADVFLVSSHSESVPLTLLESLACGTPVVSTNVGIANDVLGRKNGFVVNTRSADDLCEKVIASTHFKSKYSLLPNHDHYTVEYAAKKLNDAFNN